MLAVYSYVSWTQESIGDILLVGRSIFWLLGHAHYWTVGKINHNYKARKFCMHFDVCSVFLWLLTQFGYAEFKKVGQIIRSQSKGCAPRAFRCALYRKYAQYISWLVKVLETCFWAQNDRKMQVYISTYNIHKLSALPISRKTR